VSVLRPPFDAAYAPWVPPAPVAAVEEMLTIEPWVAKSGSANAVHSRKAVHEHVDAAERLQDGLGDPSDRAVLRQVCGNHERVVHEVGGDRLQPVGGPGDEGHTRPTPVELPDDRFSDPSARSGDDGPLPREVV